MSKVYDLGTRLVYIFNLHNVPVGRSFTNSS